MFFEACFVDGCYLAARRVLNPRRDPVPGLFVCPDEDLVTVVHALVTGPFDTPYEGGGCRVYRVVTQLHKFTLAKRHFAAVSRDNGI